MTHVQTRQSLLSFIYARDKLNEELERGKITPSEYLHRHEELRIEYGLKVGL